MAAEATREQSQLGMIRAMHLEDAGRVSEILREASEAVFWPEAGVKEALSWPGTLGFVVESAGIVTAFLLARQIADEAEILNLAVEKESRRKGQAGVLLRSVEGELRARGVKRLFLEVREANEPAIAFYENHSFCESGRRPAYYRDPPEAAILMEKRLTA
jgi:ribosomal-protein-alanine acetyltransferase